MTVGSAGPYRGILEIENDGGLLHWWVDIEFTGQVPPFSDADEEVRVRRGDDLYVGPGRITTPMRTYDNRGTARVVGCGPLRGPGLPEF